MSARAYDAVVIGAGVSGLVAACMLAKKGKRVLVAEARNKLGGFCESAAMGEGFSVPIGAHVLYALDPRLAKELKLARHGLKFAVRDMALTGLGHGGRHVSILRDVHDTVRNIAIHSKADAQAWPRFRKELFALGRALRPLWWEAGPRTPLARPLTEALERLKRVSAAAWLDSWFESDALKATLAFDATAESLSPFEPGSALLLVWRASQEICGLQGAAAQPLGGPAALATAIAACAKELGVEIQTGARVARILVQDRSAAGIELVSGGTVAANLVLSSLSRRQTLESLVPAGTAGFEAVGALAPLPKIGAAKIVLALKTLPAFNGVAVPVTARFVAADRLETYAAACSTARAGRLPDEVTMEFVIPSAAEPALAPLGQHVLSALIRPVPMNLTDAMKTQLAAKVVSALETHLSGLSRAVSATQVLAPQDIADRYGYNPDGFETARMLADWNERLMTPVSGLMLCGAEPVSAVSGRAGRIAAMLASGAAR
jgi:phytoene dehydrogenase-like protein